MRRVPWIDLYVSSNYDAVFYLTFEDVSHTVPRPLYSFPPGTTFRLVAKGALNISKSSAAGNITYNEHERRVEIHFVPADTAAAAKDERIPHEMDCVFPDGKRYPLAMGEVRVQKMKGLTLA